MGKYDTSWDNLPSATKFDVHLRTFILSIHNIFVILICIKRYGHDTKDKARRFLLGHNENQAQPQCHPTVPRSFESFLSNVLIMAIMLVGRHFTSIFVK